MEIPPEWISAGAFVAGMYLQEPIRNLLHSLADLLTGNKAAETGK